MPPRGHRYTGRDCSHWNHRVETIYKVALIAVLGIVIFNLWQALYLMMKDTDDEKRTVVKSLTRRIGFSLLLILMVIIGIWAGWLKPHGIGG